jgi:adenylate cyclase
MASLLKKYINKLSVTKTYRAKWFLLCIFFWTLLDIYILNRWEGNSIKVATNLHVSTTFLVLVRIGLSIIINIIIILSTFFILYKIREYQYPILIRIIKCISVIFVVLVLICLRFLVTILVGNSVSFANVKIEWWTYLTASNFIIDIGVIKCLLIINTILIYQLGQKYTPRFFINILLGKYVIPKEEERIIMFIDLRDSTPISEQLGHKKYFLFIRDFINTVSNAALQCGADIYQYVGDEIIVTWPKQKTTSQKCIQTLILARKYLGKQEKYFKLQYGFVPEFRAGIHIGKVTIGEIGILKKDIAMSGEAMNTTARIRSACNELNQKHIVSEDYFEFTQLKSWQGQDLGVIPLKGLIKKETRLFGLRI